MILLFAYVEVYLHDLLVSSEVLVRDWIFLIRLCHGFFNFRHTGLALAWGGQLVYDAVVFFLTLYKSILIVRTSHRPLISTLLRDGKSALIPHFVCFLRCHPISRCPVFCVSNIVAGADHCLQCCARILTVANLANILTFLVKCISFYSSYSSHMLYPLVCS